MRTSQRIEPRPKTSARRSTLSMSPPACSGAMYAGVPSTLPACDSSSAEPLRTVRITLTSTGGGLRFVRSSATPPSLSTFASPQSITCTSPKLPTITFDGFRSR